MDESDKRMQSSQAKSMKPGAKQKKVRYWGSWVSIVLGILILPAGVRTPRLLLTGMLMIVCGCAYMSRKRQMYRHPGKRSIIEMICLLLALILVCLAIISTNVEALYYTPFTETAPIIVAIWTIIAYLFFLRKYRKVEQNQQIR